jgi:hypothetical protein
MSAAYVDDGHCGSCQARWEDHRPCGCCPSGHFADCFDPTTQEEPAVSQLTENVSDPFATVPFPREVLDGLHAMRDHYWARSNSALDEHDSDAFTLWNRRAKQVTAVVATAQEVWLRDRDAWASAQSARLAARNGEAPTTDE